MDQDRGKTPSRILASNRRCPTGREKCEPRNSADGAACRVRCRYRRVSQFAAWRDKTKRERSDGVQVGVVMQTPFRPRHHDHVAAPADAPDKKHNARRGARHDCPPAVEDVDALVDPGQAPRLVPEGFPAPVAECPTTGITILSGIVKPAAMMHRMITRIPFIFA